MPDYTNHYPIEPTPEPQSFAVKAGKIKAKASALNTAHLEKNAKPLPPTQVVNVDGVPTVVSVPLVSQNVGQLVSEEDLRLMGEEPVRFPECEVPGCKDAGDCQLVNGAGRPLSFNRKGELVVGDLPPLVEEGMSANDRARAQAGLVGVVGPSGVMAATLATKSYVNVCFRHQRSVQVAPKKAAPKRFQSGPYGSYHQAMKRVHQVGARSRIEATVRTVKRNGVDEFYVIGDDGGHGFKGQLIEIGASK